MPSRPLALYRLMFVAMLIGFLGGCASLPELSREEWLAFHNKTYENVTTDEVIEAAEKALETTDPRDMTFSHRKDGFLATRPWLYYMVIGAASGTDFYDLTVTELDDGRVRAELYMTRSGSMMAATPNVGGAGGTSVTTIPGNSQPIESTAASYAMWKRFDYFLGLEDQWYDCPRIKALKDADPSIWGHTDNVCGIGLSDDPPPPVD